ncbi:MAG: 16S rRNA (guanine(527)-N(7))-methyltransferase RsmG [Propionibacterium sp.]
MDQVGPDQPDQVDGERVEKAARNVLAEQFESQFGLMNRYVDILTSRGIDWGLIGPREAGKMWSRHILNCAGLVSLIPEGSTVADIGSGAGLPGLVVAILRPDLTVTLLESLLRRADFLSETIEELGLSYRVRVIRGRAEEHDEYYDVVTARAVARLKKLLGWAAPLMDERGQLLALKGRSAEAEVLEAEAQLTRARLMAEVLKVQLSPTAEPSTVVRVRGA